MSAKRRQQVEPTSSKCIDKPNNCECKRTKLSQEFSIFTDIKAYIVSAGIGKARCELFARQIKNLGGMTCDKFVDDTITHVIIDEKMDTERLRRILNINASYSSDRLKSIKFVKSLWLSACIRTRTLVDTKDFELAVTRQARQESAALAISTDQLSTNPIGNLGIAGTSKSAHPETSHSMEREHNTMMLNLDVERDSDYLPSDEDRSSSDLSETDDTSTVHHNVQLPKGSWICAQSSASQRTNYNKHITDKLEEMAKNYENMNDRWRALGYQKAITALKRHPNAIASYEEAKNLFGVGARLAEKIWEIAENGELRKLNEIKSLDEMQAVNLFANVWGAGVKTARGWVAQGLRTLEDLQTKGSLTRNQQIGLKYYEELLDRMPREEAAEIESTVKEMALLIQPGLIAMACGSYRRGKQTCGDVDVLITHPDGKSHAGVFKELIERLHTTGFLTDDLVSVESEGEHKKYLGVCKLPGDCKKHRRLDIIIVPYSEFACALMYFTGSAHFNRSLRHLASRLSMSLNEHALSIGVVRSRGEKVSHGTRLYTPTEQSIFDHFNLPYRPPEERDH